MEPEAIAQTAENWMEYVSAWSHLISAVVAGSVGIMWILRIKLRKRVKTGLIVLVAGTVTMFSMSGFYHLMPLGGTPRLVLRYLDHSAIFLMIADTLTPIHLILFKGWYRWGPLTGVWLLAAAGILVKCLFFDGIPEWLSLSIYLAFGWLGAWSGYHVLKRHGAALASPLILGGVAYSIGAILEFYGTPILIDRYVGPHELFHVTVMIGVVFHWRFVALAIKKTAKAARKGKEGVRHQGRRLARMVDEQGRVVARHCQPQERGTS